MSSSGSTGIPYLGSKISLISKSEIRYEGILYTVDTKESTIALAKVRSFGTEERRANAPVPPRDEIYEYIIFKASDIKDLVVCETPQPVPQLSQYGHLPNDPAIVSVSQVPNSSFASAVSPQGPTGLTSGSTVPFSGMSQHQQQGQKSGGFNMGSAPSSRSATPQNRSVSPSGDISQNQSRAPGAGRPLGMNGVRGGGQGRGGGGSNYGGFSRAQGGGGSGGFHQGYAGGDQQRRGGIGRGMPPRGGSYGGGSSGGFDRPQGLMGLQPHRMPFGQSMNRMDGPGGFQGGMRSYSQAVRRPAPGGFGRMGGDGGGFMHPMGGFHNNFQPRGGHRGMNNGSFYRGGGGMNRGGFRGGGPGSGNRNQRGEPLKFDVDYDFVEANEKFQETLKEVKEGLTTKLKIGDGSVHTEPTEPSENGEHVSAEVKLDLDEGVVAGSDLDKDGPEEDIDDEFYNKEKSFFDNISCEALEKTESSAIQKPGNFNTRRRERDLNQETFGQSALGGYRGARGGRGGGGYGFNRGFNQGYRPRGAMQRGYYRAR